MLSSSCHERPRNGASFEAVPPGSLTTRGFAKTVTEFSDTASSTPFRSVIVPRRAATVTSSTCCATARRLRSWPRTVPSQAERRPASRRRTRNTANSVPILRSTATTARGP